MLVFDASSILVAWDDYPPDHFPPLWDWMDDLLAREEVVMSAANLAEVKHISEECHERIVDAGLLSLPVTQEVLVEALRIQGLLGIANDNYHPHGVDENDLYGIATASLNRVDFISNESLQPALPDNMRRYKIPAVCALADVGVTCIGFRRFFRREGVVFR